MAEEVSKIYAVENGGNNAMTLATLMTASYSDDTKIWSYIKH